MNGESIWPGFDIPSRRHIWVEFVGSLHTVVLHAPHVSFTFSTFLCLSPPDNRNLLGSLRSTTTTPTKAPQNNDIIG